MENQCYECYAFFEFYAMADIKIFLVNVLFRMKIMNWIGHPLLSGWVAQEGTNRKTINNLDVINNRFNGHD